MESSTVMDLEAVKRRQQATWASGDYAVVGTTLQIVGESLCEAVDLGAGSKVLDVAAGNGNASLAAARRHCEVTSTDYVQALLDRGRERADAERLAIHFRCADAEDLPFEDGSFDVTLSVYGSMFTPDHRRCANEMTRVTRSGGKIGLANWTPEGFIGNVFKTVGQFVPPVPGVQPASMWGTESHIHDLFDGCASAIRLQRRMFKFRYRDEDHYLDVFRRFYGPVHKAYLALDENGRQELTQALRQTIRQFARPAASLIIPSEYLEVVVLRA